MAKKIELLAPAGSPEKMEYAFHYGADAVYAGAPDFSMRRRINSFTEETLKKGIEYAHKLGKKFYVTVNIYAHNIHIKNVVSHLKFLAKANPDAIILSDPGILMLVKKYVPKIKIHLSTQANATNWQAVKFWKEQGVRRVILAREVTLEEIKDIKKNVPGIELEYFVHGAMCMSYSGRCILSKWMVGRSANLGDCVQACRWKYKSVSKEQRTESNKVFSMSVEDDKGEFEIDLEEDQNGTYFFNSRDLNLLEYLGELQKAGVSSFKIEGRNKSVYYVALVTRAYRKVLDALQSKMSKIWMKKIIQEQQKELNGIANRGYDQGFLLGYEPRHNFQNSHVEIPCQFVGEVLGREGELLRIKVHNAIRLGDKLEIITPKENIKFKVKKILDDKNQEVRSAHGGQGIDYYINSNKGETNPFSLLRKVI